MSKNVNNYVSKDSPIVKGSKVTWNYEPQAIGFTVKLKAFYDVIFIAFESVHHVKT